MFEGCPAEDSSVPFETKEFNMSEYLDADRAEDFVGRQWLFREVEDAFEEENIAGVQIIGSPGSGKSALASQLISGNMFADLKLIYPWTYFRIPLL